MWPEGTPEVKALLADVATLWTEFEANKEIVLEGTPGVELDMAVAEILNESNELLTLSNAAVIQLQHESEGKTTRLELIMWIMGAIGVVVMIAAIWVLRRSVAPLQKMTGVAEALAEGDLTQVVEVTSKDEAGQLAGAFREMTRGLVESITQVTQATDSVNNSSAELSDLTTQSGQVTQQIAITIQEVAEGTGSASESLQNAAEGIAQLTEASKGVSQGAQDQAVQVRDTQSTIGEMVEAIARSPRTRRARSKPPTKPSRPPTTGPTRWDERLTAWRRSTRPSRKPRRQFESWARAARGSATSSARSTTSPIKPTCWR